MSDEKKAAKPIPKRAEHSDAEIISEMIRGRPRTDLQRANVAELNVRLAVAKMRRVFHDAEEKLLGVKAARTRCIERDRAGIKVEELPEEVYANVVNTAKSAEEKAREKMVPLTEEQLTNIPKTAQERADLRTALVNASGVNSSGSKVVG